MVLPPIGGSPAGEAAARVHPLWGRTYEFRPVTVRGPAIEPLSITGLWIGGEGPYRGVLVFDPFRPGSDVELVWELEGREPRPFPVRLDGNGMAWAELGAVTEGNLRWGARRFPVSTGALVSGGAPEEGTLSRMGTGYSFSTRPRHGSTPCRGLWVFEAYRASPWPVKPVPPPVTVPEPVPAEVAAASRLADDLVARAAGAGVTFVLLEPPAEGLRVDLGEAGSFQRVLTASHGAHPHVLARLEEMSRPEPPGADGQPSRRCMAGTGTRRVVYRLTVSPGPFGERMKLRALPGDTVPPVSPMEGTCVTLPGGCRLLTHSSTIHVPVPAGHPILEITALALHSGGWSVVTQHLDISGT